MDRDDQTLEDLIKRIKEYEHTWKEQERVLEDIRKFEEGKEYERK